MAMIPVTEAVVRFADAALPLRVARHMKGPTALDGTGRLGGACVVTMYRAEQSPKRTSRAEAA